ncbi:MAG: hypothetical protein SVU32_08805, partial [Candidatus Nanohaloarchaea archaeon]|nr:hypothetical protein [Candidatus Nanohaloarchaea archaeon]
NHVWQAGAKKTEDKGRLDITHYDTLTDDQIEAIQEQARTWLQQDLPVTKQVMRKDQAEEKYGFIIYQGGVPPGNQLRVVRIGDDIDVEACGGTHVDSTGEIDELIITDSKKVQDGVIRLEYRAGEAAKRYREKRKALEKELGQWLDLDDYTLDEVADIFSVPVDELSGVVERFVDEWNAQREEVWEFEGKIDEPVEHDYDEMPHDPQELFDQWKQQKKDIERLEDRIEDQIKDELTQRDDDIIREQLDIKDIGTLIQIAQHVTQESPGTAVILTGENAVIAAQGDKSDIDLEQEVSEQANVVQTEDSLVKGFDLKR